MVTDVFNSSSSEFFNPDSIHLKHFIEHYKYFNIDKCLLSSEFLTAKTLCLKENYENLDLYNISHLLNKVHNAFPETLKIISILMTLPATTATNERFFSSLKRVKNYLRLTMGDDRLSDLLVINVESTEASKINLGKAVDKFAHLKERRYPLIA